MSIFKNKKTLPISEEYIIIFKGKTGEVIEKNSKTIFDLGRNIYSKEIRLSLHKRLNGEKIYFSFFEHKYFTLTENNWRIELEVISSEEFDSYHNLNGFEPNFDPETVYVNGEDVYRTTEWKSRKKDYHHRAVGELRRYIDPSRVNGMLNIGMPSTSIKFIAGLFQRKIPVESAKEALKAKNWRELKMTLGGWITSDEFTSEHLNKNIQKHPWENVFNPYAQGLEEYILLLEEKSFNNSNTAKVSQVPIL